MPGGTEATLMRRALALAERGRGFVEPNPVVGCVILKGERVIGEGWHRRFGGPHAEVKALGHATGRLKSPGLVGGATVYVTLEPCCHHGKTGPCTEALIAAGVERVVVACVDPFPQVSGKGIARLREAGIAVEVGVCEAEAKAINAPFFKRVRSGLPYVIAKWAMTADGAIATGSGESKWISGERSRAAVHRLRGRVDAVVVGIGTVIADDPLLTARGVKSRRIARRVVIDPSLRLPLDSRLVRSSGEAPVTVAVSAKVSRRKVARAEAMGIEIVQLALLSRERLDLTALMRHLSQVHDATNILVEGGGHTLGAFFEERLVDEAIVFTGPLLLGDPAAVRPVVMAPTRGGFKIAAAHRLELIGCRRVGDDVLARYRVSPPNGPARA